MECLQMEMRDRGLDGIKCTTVNSIHPKITEMFEEYFRCVLILREHRWSSRRECDPLPRLFSWSFIKTKFHFRWIPFMSVDSCSRRIVDAILKEKVVAFMPNYVHLVPFFKGSVSYQQLQKKLSIVRPFLLRLYLSTHVGCYTPRIPYLLSALLFYVHTL